MLLSLSLGVHPQVRKKMPKEVYYWIENEERRTSFQTGLFFCRNERGLDCTFALEMRNTAKIESAFKYVHVQLSIIKEGEKILQWADKGTEKV